MTPTNATPTHLPVDGPVIVIGAHNETLGVYHSLVGAHSHARQRSIGYNEAWVYVSVPSETATRWMKQSYFYHGKRHAGWPAPVGRTWEQLVWDQRQEETVMVKVVGAGN